MKRLAKKFKLRIEDWSDERNIGNELLVTLRYGWSFERTCHEGVRGFVSISEAEQGLEIRIHAHVKNAGPKERQAKPVLEN